MFYVWAPLSVSTKFILWFIARCLYLSSFKYLYEFQQSDITGIPGLLCSLTTVTKVVKLWSETNIINISLFMPWILPKIHCPVTRRSLLIPPPPPIFVSIIRLLQFRFDNFVFTSCLRRMFFKPQDTYISAKAGPTDSCSRGSAYWGSPSIIRYAVKRQAVYTQRCILWNVIFLSTNF